jgi:hypothetical protein
MTDARSVLVIATVEQPGDALRQAVGDGADVRIVVPAVRQSRLQWWANDEDAARERAQAAAERIGEALPVDVTEARAGDPDPLQAAEDALRLDPADEIVVVVRPEDEADWLEQGAAEEISRRFALPVRHVVLPDGS